MDKKDVVFVFVLAAFSFLLLSQSKGLPIKSYSILLQSSFDPTISVVIGVALTIIVYVLLRTKFSNLISLSSTLLFITSPVFVQSFSFGQIVSWDFSFSLQKINEVQFLLPLALFGVFSISMKKITYAVLVLLFIISFFSPILSLPFLAILCAIGLREFKDKESMEKNITIGALLSFFIILFFLRSTTVQAVAASFLITLLLVSVLYISEFRRKINISLIFMTLLLSIINAQVSQQSIERIDSETLSAISQLKNYKGKLAIASIYGERIAPVALYELKKEVSVLDAFEFLFSNRSSNFDYLLLDTLVLDDPKNYSFPLNLSVKFETFALAKKEKRNNTINNIFVSKSNYLTIFTDEAGRLASDRAFVGNEEVSFHRLLELNASDGRFARYIYPREQTELNILKLLFPGQFGETANEVWSSNSSRMRIYKIK